MMIDFLDLMHTIGRSILNNMDGPSIAKLKMLSSEVNTVVCERDHRNADNSYDNTHRAIDAVSMNDLRRLQAVWPDLYHETRQDVLLEAAKHMATHCILWMLAAIDHIEEPRIYCGLFAGVDGVDERVILAMINARRWTTMQLARIVSTILQECKVCYPEAIKRLASLMPMFSTQTCCMNLMILMERDYPEECVRDVIFNARWLKDGIVEFLTGYPMYAISAEQSPEELVSLLEVRTRKALNVMPFWVIKDVLEWLTDNNAFYVVCGQMFLEKYLSFGLNCKTSEMCLRAHYALMEHMAKDKSHGVDVVRIECLDDGTMVLQRIYPVGYKGVQFW